jgi:hypothetical protein
MIPENAHPNGLSRRAFLRDAALGAATLAGLSAPALAQVLGVRPSQSSGVTILNPRDRVPVGLIIDDSTCLVNLNRFAMPQFDTAWNGSRQVYQRDWRSWSPEIPDNFVRKFGEWCAEHGVKGKYSIVPYPACVGRLDLEVPGWSRREINDSIRLVRDLMMPNWDIHPEMVTHTRVIDLKTGHPYPEYSPRFMENWDWTTGRSVDELAAYHAYALQILKNIDLPCEGLTTPGGYGGRALPELAQATLQSVRDVFNAEIPHYFRHLYTDDRSVAPRVEYASGLDTDDPRCVVSVIGCTGDWTGGWDNVEPEGVDQFITADLGAGRMVDVIRRGEPAMMVCHWTGIHWNGEEKGFRVFQEVVGRLHARFNNLIWMKLSELSRYWAAKELTRIESFDDGIQFNAPFACPDFTVSVDTECQGDPLLRFAKSSVRLDRVGGTLHLRRNSWCPAHDSTQFCFDLPKGASRLTLI